MFLYQKVYAVPYGGDMRWFIYQNFIILLSLIKETCNRIPDAEKEFPLCIVIVIKS